MCLLTVIFNNKTNYLRKKVHTYNIRNNIYYCQCIVLFYYYYCFFLRLLLRFITTFWPSDIRLKKKKKITERNN